MHYITIIICCSFLALCYVVSRNVSRFKKTHGQSHEEFLEQESRANSVRKADISALPYVEIPLDELPLDALSACGYSALAEELRALASVKILNLSMYTNTELKLMYGPAPLSGTIKNEDQPQRQLLSWEQEYRTRRRQ